MKTLENVIQKWDVSIINNSSATTFHRKLTLVPNNGHRPFYSMVRYAKYLDMPIDSAVAQW